jgi:histone H3/H4
MPRTNQTTTKSAKTTAKQPKELNSGIRKKRRKDRKKMDREVKKEKEKTTFLIPKLSLERLIREVSQEFTQAARFKKSAITTIQAAAEDFLENLFANANTIKHVSSLGRAGRLFPRHVASALLVDPSTKEIYSEQIDKMITDEKDRINRIRANRTGEPLSKADKEKKRYEKLKATKEEQQRKLEEALERWDELGGDIEMREAEQEEEEEEDDEIVINRRPHNEEEDVEQEEQEEQQGEQEKQQGEEEQEQEKEKSPEPGENVSRNTPKSSPAKTSSAKTSPAKTSPAETSPAKKAKPTKSKSKSKRKNKKEKKETNSSDSLLDIFTQPTATEE